MHEHAALNVLHARMPWTTGKYRFNKKEFAPTAGGLPRLMVRGLVGRVGWIDQCGTLCSRKTSASFSSFHRDSFTGNQPTKRQDMGQCNDAFSAIKVASALAEHYKCGVNDLPINFAISWFEQKGEKGGDGGLSFGGGC